MFLGEQQDGAVVEHDALELGQRYALAEDGAAQQGGNDDEQPLHSCTPSAGDRRIPTVMLSRRKTCAATA